jgi:hypothetical protein
MNPRKCSYCEAKASSKSSLADQGWMAIILCMNIKGTSHRFHARACPLHRDILNKEAGSFYKKLDDKGEK